MNRFSLTMLTNIQRRIIDRMLDDIARPIAERLKIAGFGMLVYAALATALVLAGSRIEMVAGLSLLATLLFSTLLGIRWAIPVGILTIGFLQLLIAVTNDYPTPRQPLVALFLYGIAGLSGGILGTLLQRVQIERRRALMAIAGRDSLMNRLLESEKRYRLLAEGTSDVTYLTDKGGNFTYVSPSALDLTGYDPDSLIGEHFAKLIDPGWYQSLDDFYANQIRERIPETVFEVPIITTTGERKWVEQTVALMTEGDRVTGFNAIMRDVTTRKQLEVDLMQARDRALEASRFKTQILANVSHDARTPLSSIILTLDMLVRGYYGEVTGRQRDKLQMAINNGYQLTEFISNLLDKAQIESGSIQLHNDIFETRMLIRNAERVLRPLVEERGLAFEINTTPDFPDMLEGDLERLRQILYNLVSNAIKFTNDGMISVHLIVSDDDHWAIQVSDTGIGIGKDDLAHIFDPFWQVDGSQTRKVQDGVGLGLSIVRELAQIMSGTITAKSELGKGTTITVSLPYKPDGSQAEASAAL